MRSQTILHFELFPQLRLAAELLLLAEMGLYRREAVPFRHCPSPLTCPNRLAATGDSQALRPPTHSWLTHQAARGRQLLDVGAPVLLSRGGATDTHDCEPARCIILSGRVRRTW